LFKPISVCDTLPNVDSKTIQAHDRGSYYEPRYNKSMGAIDVKDVQAKIAEMLEAVEQGQTLSITRDGKAFALLEPAPRREHQAMPSLAEFRASLKVNEEYAGNSVVEMREQERY
jgi:antitoxin (DNA-binding transcriptional repressor) of toxin-antitoxin stability system